MTLLSYLPAIAVLVLTSLIIINVFAAAIFDIKQLRRMKKINSVARRKKIQPVVSVIILCSNHQDTVIETVKSILNGGIKKLRITIVDNVSTDNSKKVIRSYITNHPEQKIRFVARRKYDRHLAHKPRILSKYTNGELTYVIHGNQQIYRGGLKTLRNYFVSDESLQFVEPMHKPEFEPAISGILRLVSSLVYERAKKLKSTKSIEYSQTSYMFRSNLATKNKFNTLYTNNVNVIENESHVAGPLQTLNPVQLLFDCVVLLLILASIVTATPVLFLIGWMAASADFIVMLFNSTTPLRERLRLAVYVPLMYLFSLFSSLRGIFYILKNIRTHNSSAVVKL